MSTDVLTIAFYLPQFHPIAENDAWWGAGFTEWHNVISGKPRFRGHYQPHIPADLGFYDLRLRETREAQAELAHHHRVDAFAYYHYWFEGRRLLHQPLDSMLADPCPDHPFLLCWANESWRRNWDGRSGTTLVEQTYSEEDDLAHIRWMLPVMGDSRYLRLSGRPVLLVYRASDLPDPRRTLDLWRRVVSDAGLGDLLACSVESFSSDDPRSLGFDAAVEFAPDWSVLSQISESRRNRIDPVRNRLIRSRKDRVVRYDEFVDGMLAKPAAPYPRFPCVTPQWDNSARRKEGGTVLRDATPEKYGCWLSRVLERHPQTLGLAERVVFVNAWNEWGEGCHLEPDRRHGRSFLEHHRATVVEAKRQEHPKSLHQALGA